MTHTDRLVRESSGFYHPGSTVVSGMGV